MNAAKKSIGTNSATYAAYGAWAGRPNRGETHILPATRERISVARDQAFGEDGMNLSIVAPALAAALLAAGCAESGSESGAPQTPAFDGAAYEIVDLSHEFGPDTVYWPNTPLRFEHNVIFEGEREDGLFYSAFSFAMPEHGGTHLDAPYHFHPGGDTAEAVPLSRLVAPAAVIDVTAQAAADPLYRLTADDVRAFEAEHGEIAAGTIVLLRTGWSRFWRDAQAYLGGTDAANLSFPSFGVDAARLLVEERRAAALGIDTGSTDYGPSTDFPVHRIMGAANTPGFENLTNLDRLPPKGAFIVALPTKIAGGSGGPLRAIAFVPKEQR
ncbi:MAG: cyclase family protein [Parvularculaceae bacterium]